MRKFKKGDTLRTSFKGTRRSQVYRLVSPVSNLGNELGGHWRVKRLESKDTGVVLVDNCPRVPPSELRRMGLKRPIRCHPMDLLMRTIP